MSTAQLSSQDRVTTVVRRILAERSINRPFAAQDDLRDVGLTSLDMVNLVLAVESELGVAIPEAEITPTNFRSVSSIDALVNALRDDQRTDLRGGRKLKRTTPKFPAISVISFLRIASANVS